MLGRRPPANGPRGREGPRTPLSSCRTPTWIPQYGLRPTVPLAMRVSAVWPLPWRSRWGRPGRASGKRSLRLPPSGVWAPRWIRGWGWGRGGVAWVNRGGSGNRASLFTSRGAAARKFRYEAEVGNIGINIGVAAPMAFFPFSGWRNSFFGTLHAQGKHAVEVFTPTKA